MEYERMRKPIAKSYPDYQSILQQMTAVKNGAFSDVIKGLPDYRNLPGLPLRTRRVRPGRSAEGVCIANSVRSARVRHTMVVRRHEPGGGNP